MLGVNNETHVVRKKYLTVFLLTDAYEELCYWLCVSITELRKEDSSEYTPKSIAQYIAGLQHYIIDEKGVQVKLADPDNSVFRLLH